MSSVPPPPYEHPGSPPPRPELPEGVEPSGPLPAYARADGAPRKGPHWVPRWAPWAPFAAMAVTVGVALVGVTLIAVAAELAGADVSTGDPPPGVTIGGTLVQDLGLVLSALLFARMVERPRLVHFGLTRTAPGRAVGWIALAWALFFAFSFAWAAALGITESEDLPQELGAEDSTLNLVVVALLVTVVAPVTEEFFFRGFLFATLWRRVGLLPAAIVGGAIFGAIHFGSAEPEFIPPLAVFGLLLCLLYVWTRSLLPCIVLHALNNGLALGVSLSWEWWQVLATMGAAAAVCLLIVLPLSAPRLAAAPA